MTEYPHPIEIDTGSELWPVAFSTNGKYTVSGHREGVRVWRVEDGKQAAVTMGKRRTSYCLAVSEDGKWIAAGTWSRDDGLFVKLDGKTFEVVFEHKKTPYTYAIDFSPDSKKLVSASNYGEVIIYDIVEPARELREAKVQILHHDAEVLAAKYSQQGDRIAIATPNSVLVWDSNDGRLLVDIQVKVTPWFNAGLVWLNNHLYVVSKDTIKKFDAFTGSIVAEWPVPGGDGYSCVALPKHGRFIAYSTKNTITFWDTSTHAQLGLIQHSQDIQSITFSPDGQSLALGGKDRKITIICVSRTIDSIPLSPLHPTPQELATEVDDHASSISLSPLHPTSQDPAIEVDNHASVSLTSLSPRHPTPQEPDIRVDNAASDPSTPSTRPHPTLQEPDIQIDDAVLHSWKHDQLEDTEALLTVAIFESQNPDHHLFSSRALVRSRQGKWDAALEDAEMAIGINPSIVSFIAKSVAHAGRGERHKAYRTCDIAFERFHSSHITSLLLIKAIIVFMAGEYPDAISRIDDLIATVSFNSMCYTVQARAQHAITGRALPLTVQKAYMYLLRGISQMESSDYEAAIQSFERAQAQIRDCVGPPIFAISLITGWKLDKLDITVRQRLCEALDAADRTNDAIKYFHKLKPELEGHSEHLEWARAFGQRSSKKLEHLGDTAVKALQHDEAVSLYTTALSLVPSSPQAILTKRSKAWLATGSWREALIDANEVIVLDPSSPWGYEMKHAALHKGGDYDSAVSAFETMLMRISESHDPDVQRHGDQYISPSSTRALIRKIVHRILRHSPRVLINTVTGRLHNRVEQIPAFESLPIFKELVSSMTTRINYVRIKREVREYFRYVILSHKWEDNEPLYHQVVNIAVYDLEQSPSHDKLQTFCRIVRDAGFHWAWSDTCCIDKSDHFILQEALVAMFKWYQGSAMMIVFLRGVRPSSLRGALAGSLWNTRAWTLQEFIAAKAIRFYTEDWTLYRDLEMPNHKESPEIISEMEQATGVSAEQLMALRPGLSNIWEKLCLASTRRTTWVEDAAYSLLGIFSAIGIPVIYGEGEASLGRLLANVLTRSGDVSTLAWTGESSPFNSCLPARITVYNGSAMSHLPAPIPNSEMERIIARLHASSFDLDVALRLYDRLNELLTPRFAESRMTLPCIAFKLPSFSAYRTSSGRVYRADTTAFGMVEVRTRLDLSRTRALYLVHPWLDTLLEHEDIRGRGFVDDDIVPQPSRDSDEEISDEEVDDDSSLLLGSPPLPSPVEIGPVDRETGARRLAVRLRQPFGALLLQQVQTRRRAMEYRRVAADCLITVLFQESVSLTDILDNVRALEVL